MICVVCCHIMPWSSLFIGSHEFHNPSYRFLRKAMQHEYHVTVMLCFSKTQSHFPQSSSHSGVHEHPGMTDIGILFLQMTNIILLHRKIMLLPKRIAGPTHMNSDFKYPWLVAGVQDEEPRIEMQDSPHGQHLLVLCWVVWPMAEEAMRA